MINGVNNVTSSANIGKRLCTPSLLLILFGFFALIAVTSAWANEQPEQSSDQAPVNEQSQQVTKDLEITSSETQQALARKVAQGVLKESNPFDPLSAISWLERLARQTSLLNYEISFVLNIPGKDAQPFLWRHAKIDDSTQIEQLSLLNGPGFENIRVNNVVSVFQPGYPPYSMYGSAIDGPMPFALLHEPNQLQMSYQFLLVGRNRISGRSAQQIRITSIDKTRYGYHLWLDEETGMLLKLNMHGLDGKLLQQIQVTQLRIDDRVAEAFSQLQQDNLPRVINVVNPPQRKHEWTLAFLPVGMKPVKQDIHQLAITGQVAEYSLFSDGLVNVSVYIQAATGVFQDDVNLNNGANTVHSRTDGKVQVTVVGDIPLVTAQLMAKSIEVKN
ncbi:MAG: sigma-E factor negative regulatory protein RseB [Glaciecola sp.]|jgi:sigma-E factor negative regulatory protein RseB